MTKKLPKIDRYDYDATHRAARRKALKANGPAVRKYMTAAIVIGGGTVAAGAALDSYTKSHNINVGRAFTQNSQQYYVPGDSRRAQYPSKEACMADVPWDQQSECEPMSNYAGGSGGTHGGGGWYGPVYTPRDSYQPSPQYQSEPATSSNTGKGSSVPKASNSTGFGSSGKALGGSSGG